MNIKYLMEDVGDFFLWLLYSTVKAAVFLYLVYFYSVLFLVFVFLILRLPVDVVGWLIFCLVVLGIYVVIKRRNHARTAKPRGYEESVRRAKHVADEGQRQMDTISDEYLRHIQNTIRR